MAGVCLASPTDTNTTNGLHFGTWAAPSTGIASALRMVLHRPCAGAPKRFGTSVWGRTPSLTLREVRFADQQRTGSRDALSVPDAVIRCGQGMQLYKRAGFWVALILASPVLAWRSAGGVKLHLVSRSDRAPGQLQPSF